MSKKPQKALSIAELYGYTHKDFKKWGKMGGRPVKYVSDKERYQAYRHRKAQIKLHTNKQGILSMITGRVSKYRNSAEKKRAYRLRKKLNGAN